MDGLGLGLGHDETEELKKRDVQVVNRALDKLYGWSWSWSWS